MFLGFCCSSNFSQRKKYFGAGKDACSIWTKYYLLKKISQTHVTPAQAGVHPVDIVLDYHLRGTDSVAVFLPG